MTEDSAIALSKTTIEIYLAVNQDGDHYISTDSTDDAISELLSNYSCAAIRNVTITVNMDLPKTETVSVAVTVPALTPAPAEVSVS